MSITTRSGMIFDIGIAVHTAYDDEGWIGVRLDGFGGDDAGLGDSELQTPFGFTSRPVDREQNGIGCEVLYAHSGNSESFAWFGKDPRYIDKCPPLYQGSAAMWNSHGAFHLLDTENDTAMTYVPRGASAHAVTIGGDANGKDLIELRHAGGAYLNCTEADEWVLRGKGNAFINVKGDKIALNGEITTTASLTVGGVSGQPVLNVTAAVAAINALAASISAGGSAPVLATALGEAFSALAAALTPCGTVNLKAV